METTCMHAIRSLLAAAGVLFASVLVQSAATAEGPARQDATLPSVDATDPGIRLDLLSERFRELEEAGALRNYRFAGRPDPALRAWLDESRRVVDELAELRRANPRPELDRSQGFALLLPHLGPMRAETRLRAALIEDAAIRGDTAGLRGLLDGTAALAADSARDHLLIGSLVATAQADAVASSIDGLLDLGLVDAAAASGILDATASLAQPSTYAFGEAALGESAMLRTEFDRLRALPEEERALWLDEFAGGREGDFAAIGDDDLARANAYQTALSEAVSLPDREEAKAAIAALEERARAGEFGALVELLAPTFGPAFARLDQLLDRLAGQRALLAAIADGRTDAAEGANAAAFLLRAAHAATAFPPAAQADLEAVRALGTGAPTESLDAARGELRTKLAPIATALRMAARCRRCDFSKLLPRDAILVPEETAAITGAARALLVAHRIGAVVGAPASTEATSGVAGPEVAESEVAESEVAESEVPATEVAATGDAVPTILGVVAHLSNGQCLAHAIAAQTIARDLADALGHAPVHAMGAAPGVATTARTDSSDRIGAALARIRRDDPFGFRAALATERARLARTTIELPPTDGDDFPVRVMPVDPTRLDEIAPNGLAFLLAVVTPPNDALPADACDCALDGPMLSVSGWFDADILAVARAQEPRLRAHLAGEFAGGRLVAGDAPDASPFAALTAVTPIDVATRMVEANEDLARLDRLLAPAPTAPTPATP